jgi:hypothetical protein
MLKWLVAFLLVASTAAAADHSRLNRAFQGVAETAVSFQHVRDFAPHRADLAKHAMAGGAISTVVGSLSTPDAGWKAGVVIAAGKEIVNDAFLGRGRPQLDDFVVTAASAVLSSGTGKDFRTLVYFDGNNAEVTFSYRF